jgi:hypothetical protein
MQAVWTQRKIPHLIKDDEFALSLVVDPHAWQTYKMSSLPDQ